MKSILGTVVKTCLPLTSSVAPELRFFPLSWNRRGTTSTTSLSPHPLPWLVLFSWSRGGPSSYIEDLQDTVSSFTVYGEPEAGYLMNAVYYDKKGAEKELERALTQEEQRRFAELLEGGLLRRKYIRDPNFVLLDGGYPETFYADYEGSTFLEQNYYEFVPAEGRADMLKDWFAQLCAN